MRIAKVATGLVATGLVLALVLCPTLALASLSGTSTVEVGTGEFDGYWCYTIDFTWDSPQSLSHLTSFVGLEGLECACDPGIFAFPDPAGTTTGYEDGEECYLEYEGEYVCHGDPSLPDELDSYAAVKWDPSPETCDAGSTGSGSVTFYSLLAPGANEFHPSILVIKNGQNVEIGGVMGPLPQADCGVHNQSDSVGKLKSSFEE